MHIEQIFTLETKFEGSFIKAAHLTKLRPLGTVV